MIAIVGLLVLLVAVVIAAAGVATNSGGAHPLDQFMIFGQQLTGRSTGELFLYGIGVGAAGTLGLSMLFGVFNGRLASRRSRRELRGSRQETADLRLDRDRLTHRLDDQQLDQKLPDRELPEEKLFDQKQPGAAV